MKLINNEVRIENCSYCNAHCITCPREKMTRPQVAIPNDHFIDLVIQAKKLGAETISVFGYGEPLVDKDVAFKIRHCTDLKLNTFITTNASLLNADMTFALLDAGLKHIRFSAHGINYNYEKVHRGLSWNIFTKNVEYFAKASKGKCRTSAIVIPMHGETIYDITSYWEDKVDEIEIWRPHGWGGKRDYRKETGKMRRTCGRPHRGPVQIQADGKVIPCCFLTDGEIILGDTYKDSIQDILKGDKYNELRKRHETWDFKGLPCEHCDQRFISDESPLLYSSIEDGINKTSSTKFSLLED